MEINVLCVDDDEAILLALDDLLTSFGMICHAVNNGEDALAIIKNGKIDIAIIDLIMPRMSGGTLLTHLSEKFPNLPVIFLSANLTEKVLEYGLRRRGSFVNGDYRISFLHKPVKRVVLKKHIETLLEQENNVEDKSLVHNAPLLDPHWKEVYTGFFKSSSWEYGRILNELSKSPFDKNSLSKLSLKFNSLLKAMPDPRVHHLLSEMTGILNGLQEKSKDQGAENDDFCKSSIMKLKAGVGILDKVYNFAVNSKSEVFSLNGFPMKPLEEWNNLLVK